MTPANDELPGEPAFRTIAQAIARQILTGDMPPGTVLPAELQLAQRLGVHRSTVREAIRVLEQDGFVSREPGRRKLRASIPRSGDISGKLTAALVLQQVTFEELWEVMIAMEPAAAAAAAARRGDDHLAALDANLEATRNALRDSASLTELDIEFHELVAQATHNKAIQVSRLPVSQLFYPPFYAVMSRLNAGERLLVAHEQIVAAIRLRDAATARDWMEKHILDFRRGYELANLDMSAPVALP